RVPRGTAATDVSAPAPIPGRAFDGARLLAFLLVGTGAGLRFARPARMAAEAVAAEPRAGLGLGLLWILFVPVTIFAAFVTVIGIPLAVTGAALYVIALYLAPILPSLWLGRRLRGARGTGAAAGASGVTRASVRAFLLGGALVGLAMLLPWVGFPARLIAISLGFGGAVLAVREHLRA